MRCREPARIRPAGHSAEPGGSSDHAAGVRLSDRYLRSVAKVMADAAEALDHAHQAGIIHRDLKPSNLMVDRAEHCWVVDFGLARVQAAADDVASVPGGKAAWRADRLTDGTVGTRPYMAPEQYDGRADARTDVWGLGVTLYELLTLRRAFDDHDRIVSEDPPRPRNLVRNLPADLDAICWKALRKDPAPLSDCRRPRRRSAALAPLRADTGPSGPPDSPARALGPPQPGLGRRDRPRAVRPGGALGRGIGRRARPAPRSASPSDRAHSFDQPPGRLVRKSLESCARYAANRPRRPAAEPGRRRACGAGRPEGQVDRAGNRLPQTGL